MHRKRNSLLFLLLLALLFSSKAWAMQNDSLNAARYYCPAFAGVWHTLSDCDFCGSTDLPTLRLDDRNPVALYTVACPKCANGDEAALNDLPPQLQSLEYKAALFPTSYCLPSTDDITSSEAAEKAFVYLESHSSIDPLTLGCYVNYCCSDTSIPENYYVVFLFHVDTDNEKGIPFFVMDYEVSVSPTTGLILGIASF